MPSIRLFLSKLSESSKDEEVKEFSSFDFNKEISKIEAALEEENLNKEKYNIIKDIIRIISK